MLPRFRAASYTSDRWRITVEQTQTALCAAIVEMRVQLDGSGELALHLAYQLQRAERARARQLAQVQAKVIMSGRRAGIRGHAFSTRIHSPLPNLCPVRPVRWH